MGLCPQFDALMGNLTAREHLDIFAKIRGVPSDVRPLLVERTLKEMDLTLKGDTVAGTYSGGNKRKLSVALSMVANPNVNFLGEHSNAPIRLQFCFLPCAVLPYIVFDCTECVCHSSVWLTVGCRRAIDWHGPGGQALHVGLHQWHARWTRDCTHDALE